MLKKRQTLLNALMSVVQFVVIGANFFILYKFLLHTIGVEKLGLWSVVVAAASLTGFANLGLAGGVVKFVAQYIAREDHKSVVELVETAFLSLAIILGVILLLLYPVIQYVLGSIVPAIVLKDAQQILPFAMLALWITTLGQVFQSGLDGFQRIDTRSIFLMANESFYTGLCFFLVPKFALMGLAMAYLFRSATLLVGSNILLKRLLPALSFLPRRWSSLLFKEMFGYGIKFQIISIVQIILDPITKSLMTKFGSLSMTGYYEMAYRMVTQLRGVLVYANSVIVPVVADLKERTSDTISRVYLGSFKLLLFLSLPFYGIMIALIPAISQIWIGHFENSFVIFGMIVSVAYFINALCGPAYFANLGTGHLKDNVISHVLMGVLNLILGYVLGKLYHGYGVALSWGLSITIGSIYLFMAYAIHERVSFRLLISRGDVLLAIVSLLSLFGPLMIYYYSIVLFHWSGILQAGLIILIYTLEIFLPIWRHPMRGKILHWVGSLEPIEQTR